MKRTLALLFALLGWLAVILQFYLMMENRTASGPETVVRFFSFFTILTNTLLAIFFSIQAFSNGTVNGLTPVTVYIVIVGLVYQILLRHTWDPTGLQKVVDELLHSVIPVCAVVYWYLYEDRPLSYAQIPRWLLFPLVYLLYILLRGAYSGFYPYPFVDVSRLGMGRVLVNSAMMMVGFVLISALLVWVRRAKARRSAA